MSIISIIKDFFKKPEVGGVLLTCGCVVVGAVYDAIKAKTNTDTDTNNKKGDDNMADNRFNDLMYNVAEKLLNEADETRKKHLNEADETRKNVKALRNRRLNNPDVSVYMQMGGVIIGIVGQFMGFISNNNKEAK